MLKVMDMSTGKIIEDEFGSFEDEVLDAGWLPPVPELQLGLQQISLVAEERVQISCRHIPEQDLPQPGVVLLPHHAARCGVVSLNRKIQLK